MPLQGCDSFDCYTGNLATKWGNVQVPWTFASGAGVYGGGAATTGAALVTGLLVRALGLINLPTAVCRGFWVKFSGLPSGTSTFAMIVDNTGTNPVATLRLNSNGTVSLYYQNQLCVTGGMQISDNKFHWVEVSWNLVANGGGTFYIDGVLQGGGNSSTIALTNGATSWGFQSIPNVTITIDDELCWDNSSAVYPQASNFPLGPRQITVLRPSGDSAIGFSNVVPAGQHFAAVNEVEPDGDTSYVEDGTIGNQDLLIFDHLTYSPSNVTAVVLNASLKTGIPGSINNRLLVKSGAVQGQSSLAATPLSYVTRQASFPLDPSTNQSWTAGGINAATYGYLNA